LAFLVSVGCDSKAQPNNAAALECIDPDECIGLSAVALVSVLFDFGQVARLDVTHGD
jgi:hypothetical protein